MRTQDTQAEPRTAGDSRKCYKVTLIGAIDSTTIEVGNSQELKAAIIQGLSESKKVFHGAIVK